MLATPAASDALTGVAAAVVEPAVLIAVLFEAEAQAHGRGAHVELDVAEIAGEAAAHLLHRRLNSLAVAVLLRPLRAVLRARQRPLILARAPRDDAPVQQQRVHGEVRLDAHLARRVHRAGFCLDADADARDDVDVGVRERLVLVGRVPRHLHGGRRDLEDHLLLLGTHLLRDGRGHVRLRRRLRGRRRGRRRRGDDVVDVRGVDDGSRGRGGRGRRRRRGSRRRRIARLLPRRLALQKRRHLAFLLLGAFLFERVARLFGHRLGLLPLRPRLRAHRSLRRDRLRARALPLLLLRVALGNLRRARVLALLRLLLLRGGIRLGVRRQLSEERRHPSHAAAAALVVVVVILLLLLRVKRVVLVLGPEDFVLLDSELRVDFGLDARHRGAVVFAVGVGVRVGAGAEIGVLRVDRRDLRVELELLLGHRVRGSLRGEFLRGRRGGGGGGGGRGLVRVERDIRRVRNAACVGEAIGQSNVLPVKR
eukprot:31521-Pelagococcus_subviridis.AAC.3